MDSSSALAALNSFHPTSSSDILSEAQSKYGVNDLASRGQALSGVTNNLTNSIANVDPSVTGRTSGSLVTEAQRSALVAREKQPLIEDLGKNNQDLNEAQTALTSAHSFATQLAAALAGDQTNEYNRLKDTYTIAKDSEDKAAAAAADKAKQDEATREFNASQGLEQAKLSETQREFNTPKTASISDQKAAYDLAQNQSVQDSAAKVATWLHSAAGSDGYVSPKSYAQAKQAWGADGMDTTLFDKYFAGFRNPRQPSWAPYG